MRVALLVPLALFACARATSGDTAGKPATSAAPPSSAIASAPSTVASATTSTAPPSPPAVSTSVYPWLADATLAYPAPVDDLASRFSPPSGFTRVEVAPGSFGAFLRTLPLAASGTPVVSYTGSLLHPASDARISAVVAIDVGKADLQQCADSVIRLHAEWLYGLGRRDLSYRAASGADLPFKRWLAGERIVADGMSIQWKKMAKPQEPNHAIFRAYLDGVFGWANTGSLSKQGAVIDVAALAPGDFVVAPGAPGHAVLVLDLARAADGRRVALLGQGYMPAQSFQVLRASDGASWFVIDPKAALDTPFWDPFPWSALRRLGE